MRLHLLASQTHKWLAIIVGAQLLLWFTSGALMSFLPIDRVHGDHLVDRMTVAALPSGIPLTSPSAIVAATDAPIETVTYRMWLGRPVAEVATAKETRLFDARTGVALPEPTARQAETVARAAWRGSGRPATTVERIDRASTEYRGALPAWRVAFTDPDTTRVFVTADTGRIAAVRTGTWRLYDFFWGLHIMDWQGHENFNTPWLLAFAIGGLALWLGGAVLLLHALAQAPTSRRCGTCRLRDARRSGVVAARMRDRRLARVEDLQPQEIDNAPRTDISSTSPDRHACPRSAGRRHAGHGP